MKKTLYSLMGISALVLNSCATPDSAENERRRYDDNHYYIAQYVYQRAKECPDKRIGHTMQMKDKTVILIAGEAKDKTPFLDITQTDLFTKKQARFVDYDVDGLLNKCWKTRETGSGMGPGIMHEYGITEYAQSPYTMLLAEIVSQLPCNHHPINTQDMKK